MSADERQAILKAAGEGVRRAAKEGSKLEKFVRDTLTEHGYVVEFHKKNFVAKKELELDLFLPEQRVAIEIDGPAHFFPIWGQESLLRHIKADKEKNGLLIQHGYVVIRVRNITKSLSQKQQRDLAAQLIDCLSQIEEKRPSKNQSLIEVTA